MRLGFRGSLVCLATILLAVFALPAAGDEPYHALAFDGVDDYVAIADPVQVTDGPLTIEAWVWAIDAEGARIVSNRHNATGYELVLYPANPTGYHVWFLTNGTLRAEGTVAQPFEQWVHLAISYEGTGGGGVKVFANGVQIGSSTYAAGIAPTDSGLAFGKIGGGQFYYNGLIDDVRIWSAALSQPTIQAWMAQPLNRDHPNFANLEGYWKFDEGTGQTAACSLVHTSDRNGQLGSAAGDDVNDPVWSTNVSPVPTDPITLGRLKWGFR
jgi:hypothetical protein